MKKQKRPWGYFQILLKGKKWWLKKIALENGATSLQSHKERDEIWILYIPKGTQHKIKGKGAFHEIAIGNPKEEDIKRYQDDYGRK